MASAPAEPTPDARVRRWIQRHERALIVAWLAGCVVFVGVLGVWGVALGGAERAIERIDNAWIGELDFAQRELEQGNFGLAAQALERIVREDGVTSVKHKHDKEHERALSLLADAYARGDRKSKALETLERLVAFDPKDFANHFRQAQMLRAAGDAGAARAAYERVLAIHPTHWPSVEARIDMEYDGGVYGPIPGLYERYLDAWLLAPMRLVAGDTTARFEVQVDGLTHDVEVDFELPEGWSGPMRVETRGFSARVDQLTLLAPLRAGVADRPAPIVLRGGDVTATDVDSQIVVGDLSAPHGVQRVRLRITPFKRMTEDTWIEVSKAYANTLLHERFAAAKARTCVGGCDAGGTVFED